MHRRSLLKSLGVLPALAAGSSLLSANGCESGTPSASPSHEADKAYRPVSPVTEHTTNLDTGATQLLETIGERGSLYFAERAHPETGIVFDRAPVNGQGSGAQYAGGSIAATGFGLSALCVAAARGYLSASACEQRIVRTLTFLAERCPHQHGFFPHYMDGAVPAPNAEYSSMDTALLLAGTLHSSRFLNSARAQSLADTVYHRVDWPWMLNGQAAVGSRPQALCMGWLPGTGFLPARWDSYSECLLMYLLAIGSPTHPIAPAAWHAIQRNTFDYGGIRFLSSYGALFIHQYLHVWLDMRGIHDGYTDYFQNSISATRAHKTWCMLQHGRYPWVDERVWGFSASDAPRGTYAAWAAPPVVGQWDGTVAPHAAGGSLPLMPEECIVVLKSMRDHHPLCFGRYGFVNSFNPGAERGRGWFDSDVIASDLALILLMAENQRTGSVRSTLTRMPEMVRAMQAVGFRKT